MRQILLVCTYFVLLYVGTTQHLHAQSVSINVNIGNQPAWGPIGYDYAAYYYFPDIDIYYDVNCRMFYYPERRTWQSAQYLPYRFNRYDLYGMYKVVINQPQPWRYHDRYRRQYASFRGYRGQPVILNSSDRRYSVGRNNRVESTNPGRTDRPNGLATSNRPNGRNQTAGERNSYQTVNNKSLDNVDGRYRRIGHQEGGRSSRLNTNNRLQSAKNHEGRSSSRGMQ